MCILWTDIFDDIEITGQKWQFDNQWRFDNEWGGVGVGWGYLRMQAF